MPTPAESLIGRRLDGGWVVSDRAPAELCLNGGPFAAMYVVQTADGRKGFLKALDYAKAAASPDPSSFLESLTAAFNFERELLRKSADRKMDRVVSAITDGKLMISPSLDGLVQYLIFELHDGDARQQADITRRATLAGTLRALHHTATGLAQLHREGVAHLNLQPGTIWKYGTVNKVAELGSAASRDRVGLDSDSDMLADPASLPPETLYGYRDPDWNRRCYGRDLYLLGSMVTFFFTGVPATALLLASLHESHSWHQWGGTYEDVLPYLHEALEHILATLSRSIDAVVAADVLAVVAQLCNPDPRLRGHPLTRLAKGNIYSLERYISTFDSLARRAEIAFWGKGL